MDEIFQFHFSKRLRLAKRADFVIDGKLPEYTVYFVRSPNSGLFEGPYVLTKNSDLVQFGTYLKDNTVYVELPYGQ